VGKRFVAAALAALSGLLVGPPAPAVAAPPAPAVAQPAPSLYTRMRAETAALEELTQRSLENQQRGDTLARQSAAARQAYLDALARRDRAAADAAQWARTAYMTVSGPSLVGGLRGPVATAGDKLSVSAADLREAESDLRRTAGDWQDTAAKARTLSVHVAADRNAVTVRSANLRAFRTANAAHLERQQALAAAADMATYRTRVAAGQLYDGTTGPVARTALAAVRVAMAQLGKPYVFGAEGPSTFDCSGLVQYAYAHAGIALPRTARPQYRATPGVSPSQLLPGDLLFFATDKSNWDTIHHVGIYLGGGRMVHAPTTGDVVKVAPVWWAEYFGATRVVSAGRR
jgi:cell wall-associated NlpC family hydrolase